MGEEEVGYQLPKDVGEAGRRIIVYALGEAKNGKQPLSILMGIMVEVGIWALFQAAGSPTVKTTENYREGVA